MRYKIKDDINFVKDASNKAVLNIDKNGLNAYKRQRELLSKASSTSDEINNIKEEVKEIKEMLKQLLSQK